MRPKRSYEDFIRELSLASNSRAGLRKVIVNAFLDEKKGYFRGKEQVVTRYKYFVETLQDGKKIYLLRPTFLNKGIDFQVWVENFDGHKDKRPSHQDILQDLRAKRKEDPKAALQLLEAIERVWNCEEPDAVLKNHIWGFKAGLSVELMLKALKWLFIEQDVTYWNYDGRAMLLDALIEAGQG